MLAVEKRNTNIGVGLGTALFIGGQVMEGTDVVILIGIPKIPSPASLAGVMVIAGIALFMWGCFMYAQGKGYSPLVGLLGLLSAIGLLILVFLPDRHPEKKSVAASASDPRPTG
jgi:hypothetical protein